MSAAQVALVLFSSSLGGSSLGELPSSSTLMPHNLLL